MRRTAVPHHRGQRLRLPGRRLARSHEPGGGQALGRALQPTAIDLFCGAGGLSLGLQHAGFTVLVGADNDPFATETHAANIGGLTYHGDLSDPTELLEHLDAWGVRTVDLVAGGPPCQPFSRAGSSKIRSLVRAGDRGGGRSARPALAQLHGGGRAPATEGGAHRERARPARPGTTAPCSSASSSPCASSGYEVDAQGPRRLPVRRAAASRAAVHRRPASADGAMRWPEPEARTPTLRDAIGDLPPVPPAQREERSGTSAAPRDRRSSASCAASPTASTPAGSTITSPATSGPTMPRRFGCSARDRPTTTCPSISAATAATSSPTSTSGWPGMRSAARSPRTSPRTATGTSIPSSTGRSRFARPRAFRPSRTVPLCRRAQPPPSADRQRRPAAAGERARRGRSARSLDVSAIAGRASRGGRVSPGPAAAGTRAARGATHGGMRDSSPWVVLMAEMCLHRTRADQVVPVFESLRQLAPTPAGDGGQPRSRRCEAMRSLGLRWRAEGIIATARGADRRITTAWCPTTS